MQCFRFRTQPTRGLLHGQQVLLIRPNSTPWPHRGRLFENFSTSLSVQVDRLQLQNKGETPAPTFLPLFHKNHPLTSPVKGDEKEKQLGQVS